MSVKQDSRRSETDCCCNIMSWIGKFKELVQTGDSKKDSRNEGGQMNHSGIRKENGERCYRLPSCTNS